MRSNPAGDWQMGDVARLCRQFGIECRGGSSAEAHQTDPYSKTGPLHRHVGAIGFWPEGTKEMTDPAFYPVHLRRLSAEEGGGWLAEVPDLPGCMSDGETPEEAVTNVEGAILSWIEAADDLHRPIPNPSAEHSGPGAPILGPADLRQRLEARAKACGMSVNSLAAAIIAEGLQNPVGSQRRHEAPRG